MTPPALAAYMAASRLGGPVAAAVLRRRLARGREDPARVGERLGRSGRPRPAGRLAWLHAASVGEAGAALPLVSALRARGFVVLVTTGTVSSARRMAAALPHDAVHQFAPVDTAAAVGAFLDHWQPDLAVWIESELWPRLVLETARRGVPMALVNARLSEASFRRWRRLPGMARRLLGSFRAILAQDDATIARIRALGVGARFAGNLKALADAPGCDAAELATLRASIGQRPVWLAASTHRGEEEVCIAAHRALGACADQLQSDAHGRNFRLRGNDGLTAAATARSLAPTDSSAAIDRRAPASAAVRAEASATCIRPLGDGGGESSWRDGVGGTGDADGPSAGRGSPLLILAPRHPDRGEGVARLLAEAGLSAARRSAGEVPGAGTHVWLADTLGEMGLWYRFAPIAFVGGSLTPQGGHTPFEPAALGAVVLHGPHVGNFLPVYAALDGAGGALAVSGPAELSAALRALFGDPGLADGLRARAREVHAGLRPDLDAIADELAAMAEAPA